MTGILIAAVILWSAALLNIGNLQKKNNAYEQQQAQLDLEIKKEQQRTEQIDRTKEMMQTKEYIEQIAKDKLGLVYQDEIVFRAKE